MNRHTSSPPHPQKIRRPTQEVEQRPISTTLNIARHQQRYGGNTGAGQRMQDFLNVIRRERKIGPGAAEEPHETVGQHHQCDDQETDSDQRSNVEDADGIGGQRGEDCAEQDAGEDDIPLISPADPKFGVFPAAPEPDDGGEQEQEDIPPFDAPARSAVCSGQCQEKEQLLHSRKPVMWEKKRLRLRASRCFFGMRGA